MASKIVISKINLSVVPAAVQNVLVKVGINATQSWSYEGTVKVAPDGTVLNANGDAFPLTVTNLPDGTNIDIYARNQCSSSEADAVIQTVRTPDAALPTPPTVTLTSNVSGGAGTVRTMTFQYGGYALNGVIPASIRFSVGVYSYDVIVAANGVKTLNQLLNDLAAAVNATTEAQWNTYGAAPASGTTGFPPTAEYNNDGNLILHLDYQHQFGANCYNG